MPRDILSEYGKDAPHPQAPRATSGGVEKAKPIHNYAPPKGPTNIHDRESPGLHGDRHGMAHCPTAGGGGESGHPGLGATNIHKSGSQRG
jgi:hypothetical protein